MKCDLLPVDRFSKIAHSVPTIMVGTWAGTTTLLNALFATVAFSRCKFTTNALSRTPLNMSYFRLSVKRAAFAVCQIRVIAIHSLFIAP